MIFLNLEEPIKACNLLFFIAKSTAESFDELNGIKILALILPLI